MQEGEVDAFLVNKMTEIDEETVETLSEGIGSISPEGIQELIDFIEAKLSDITKNTGAI
jgi:hypothetical protein